MRSNILWLLFLLSTFIVTLPVSWWGMAKVDFFYSGLHDAIGIDTHIERYAPLNRFNKTEFEKTTKAERVALFGGVVEAIHNKGIGLDSLSYNRVSNQKRVILFTDAEVIHLKDVANLLEKLKPVVIGITLIWIVALFWIFMKRIKLPSVKRLFQLASVLVGIAILILLLGPEKVFNQLHIWVFPDNHQWFFYYEDSLMSTMMKAPHLFAYISIIWIILSIILTVVLLKSMRLIQQSKR